MANMYGVSAYQQSSSVWNSKTTSSKSEKTSTSSKTDSAAKEGGESVKTTDFKPLDTKSPLVPSTKSGYGTTIGNVELSDKAKDYYNKLKSQYHNMDFILVSKDMKSKVQANAAAYGNANKQVVLIDDEKIEKMATDENYRKKYEAIIAMSQLKLQEAKNSLASSGANIKNFGMSVDANGKTSFFATLEKSSETKAAEKKQAEKKAAKVKEKKVAEKKAKDKKLAEKKAEEKAAEKASEEAKDEVSNEPIDDKEYVEIKADSMDDLINKVSTYAYNNSSSKVLSEGELIVGQKFDFKG